MSNVNLSNFESGDSSFQDLYVYGKLNYNFENDDLKFGNATFTGAINATSQTITGGTVVTENSIATGIATVGTALYVDGKLHDGDGDFGTAGQVLSSDGTDTKWINTSDTNVGSASNVGTNVNSTDADQFITFVGSSSGNNPIRVDAGIKYNPSTNRLTAGSFAGDGSALTGVESFVTGMIILWYGNTGNVPTGFVLCDGNNSTPDLRDRFVIGAGNSFNAGDTGGNNSLTLTEANLPSHRHFVVSNDLGGQNRTNSNVSANNQVRKGTGASNLFEGYNLASTGSDAASGRTSAVGSGTAIDNKPAYHALCYIMKT